MAEQERRQVATDPNRFDAHAAQERAEAQARSQAEAEARQADELENGGRFIVDGALVNHDGEPFKE